jgi:hypothetical protein
MNDYEDKLTWRDALAYILVYALWAAISAAAAVALMLLRSAFPPPLTVLLARNPYFHTRTVELNGMITSVDRLVLIVLAVVWIVFILWVEEYFRASIVKSRERRARARIAADGALITETGLQRWSLDLFPRRLAIAAAFPAGALVLYGIIEGITLLMVRR